MHENRETSGAPRPERERGRSAKAQSHTADTHALEESDRAIVSMNQTNKEERSSAEPGEKRARAKENIVQSDTSPTQCGEVSVPRIVRCASSSIARQSSKVGAVCGSAARTVLCGGRSVMIVPTATLGPVESIGQRASLGTDDNNKYAGHFSARLEGALSSAATRRILCSLMNLHFLLVGLARDLVRIVWEDRVC